LSTSLPRAGNISPPRRRRSSTMLAPMVPESATEWRVAVGAGVGLGAGLACGVGAGVSTVAIDAVATALEPHPATNVVAKAKPSHRLPITNPPIWMKSGPLHSESCSLLRYAIPSRPSVGRDSAAA
jgi:hypothetical protein